MITAHVIKSEDKNQDDKIETTGEVKTGDVYKNFCCQGFDWEVGIIHPDETNERYNKFLGYCDNPECPEGEFPGANYCRGASGNYLEDFEQQLAYKTEEVRS